MKTEVFTHDNPATVLIVSRTRHANGSFAGTTEEVGRLHAGEALELVVGETEQFSVKEEAHAREEESEAPESGELKSGTLDDSSATDGDAGSITDAVTTSSDSGGLVDNVVSGLKNIFKTNGTENQ